MEFVEVAEENSAVLLEAFSHFNGDVEKFLWEEDVLIPVFPTTHPRPKDLRLSYDIDGSVLQLSQFHSLKAGTHYLFLRENVSQPQWHVLKKHIRPQRFSAKTVKLWIRCHGVRLSYVDGGWHLGLCLVPDENGPDQIEFLSDSLARSKMDYLLGEIADAFEGSYEGSTPAAPADHQL